MKYWAPELPNALKTIAAQFEKQANDKEAELKI